jgi:hypothetical protein
MLRIDTQPLNAPQRCYLEQFQGSRFEKAAARLLWGERLYERFHQALADDLAGNVAQHIHVEVQRLAVGRPVGDEGPLLFCDAGDGRVVCLAGQWLYDPHVVIDEIDADPDAAEWIQSFSFVRAAATGIVLELRARDASVLWAERRIDGGLVPPLPQSLILDGSLDTLEASLAAIHASG